MLKSVGRRTVGHSRPLPLNALLQQELSAKRTLPEGRFYNRRVTPLSLRSPTAVSLPALPPFQSSEAQPATPPHSPSAPLRLRRSDARPVPPRPGRRQKCHTSMDQS